MKNIKWLTKYTNTKWPVYVICVLPVFCFIFLTMFFRHHYKIAQYSEQHKVSDTVHLI